MITYIIPHYGPTSILNYHLKELNLQSYNDFEVIVVFDGPVSGEVFSETKYPLKVLSFDEHRGPASARNKGVAEANGDIVMFVGSDCIPTKDLLARHALVHMSGPEIVQGYSPWHPEVITYDTAFIDESGLQSNWKALQEDDGSWKQQVSGAFCLTTNYSINKVLFESASGFDERFKGAAWEDVEFGYRLQKLGMTIVFEPRAMNYHYHRYTLRQFLDRCQMEGNHRLTLCKIHPEMGMSLLNPSNIQQIKPEQANTMYTKALDYMLIDEKDVRYNIFYQACMFHSFLGAIESIERDHPALEAIFSLDDNRQMIQTLAGVSAIETGHYSYSIHCGEWMVSDLPDKWYSYAFSGEMLLAAGDKDAAYQRFRKALSMNPESGWAYWRVEELRPI